MDDNLELPTSSSKVDAARVQDEEEQSSGDEDQGPDWTKIPGLANARPVIPKRGEKDFEPTAHGGSGLQRHVLDRSRSAMLEALKATRTISNKSVSHAIWYPQLKRAHVTVARGIHFTTMGHSVARPSAELEGTKKVRRLELLPEEALYLVERGAMYCWSPTHIPLPKPELLDDLEGVPMSVQQVYAEMIGIEDLTLEKYQVYAYLKRLGYVVTRARPPSSDYPLPPPFPSAAQSSASIFGRLFRAASSFFSRLLNTFVGGRDWWRPIRLGRWLHHDMNYASLFHSLRFLPGGYEVPLHVQQAQATQKSPYQIFYNLYKPSTSFKKTAPPPPDFQVVIVNARTTPMPSISELTDLFGQLPELPPPVPRKRLSFAQQKLAASTAARTPPKQSSTPAASVTSRTLSWLWSGLQKTRPATAQLRPSNPFPSLKTGKKIVVVAVVDAGTISFFRFGQGVFTEWPMS